MVSFLVYDLVLLFIFIVFFSVFLHTRKKNIQREGLLILYKTSWGIKLIDYLGKKHPKTLRVLSWVSIITGYALMVSVLWLIWGIMKIYLFQPAIVRAIKVPPIIPLVPYLPQVFSLDFLPPFFFTYWIVILAVIAITHELAHGIFAAYNKVKIKTTGFGFFPWFLPIFLAAFVELDEKVMATKKKFAQLVILSAGTFANVLTAIFFFLVMGIFFALAFSPSGIIFDSYANSYVPISGITTVNGIELNSPTYQQMLDNLKEGELTEIEVNGQTYLTNKQIIESQKSNFEGERERVLLYHSSPAINANLSSIILEVQGFKISSIDDLQVELGKYKPGDKIIIKTRIVKGESLEQEIVLAEHPDQENKSWLGVGFIDRRRNSVMGKIITSISLKKPHINYEPKFDGISIFIYNLLWWMILISISVALINMLPVGIFDGGRFFYLTIWGLTGKERIAKKAFELSTWFFLFLLFLIMVFWAISFI